MFCACGLLSAATPQDSDDIRPPKARVEIPQPEKWPRALWVGAGAGAIAGAVAALFVTRSLRRGNSKSPQQVALSSLTELDAGGVALAPEAFANRAAQTLRQYIADRFGLAAPRRTTEEFLRDVEHSPLLLVESDHLRLFLKSCDLAKFAGANLDAHQRGELIKTARDFVTATADHAPNSKSKVPAP